LLIRTRTTNEDMQSLLSALANDLRAIRAGTFVGAEPDRLLTYFRVSGDWP
jgi:hypothetical protein